MTIASVPQVRNHCRDIDPSGGLDYSSRQCSVDSMQCERRLDRWPMPRQKREKKRWGGGEKGTTMLNVAVESKIDDDVIIRSCVTLIAQSVSQRRRRPQWKFKKRRSQIFFLPDAQKRRKLLDGCKNILPPFLPKVRAQLFNAPPPENL